MATISPLSLTDGTTPITLNPISHSTGETRYRASGASIKNANRSLVFQYKNVGGVNRQTCRFTDPVVHTDVNTGEEYVKENNLVKIETRFPDITSDAQRILCIKYAFSIALTAALEDELQTGEGQW